MEKLEKILELFEEISRIPRCSGNEELIRQHLVNWANKNEFGFDIDEAGNLVVRVPASPGFEDSTTVVLQAHLDMVCEKTPDSTHDFSKDPIRVISDGDFLKADGTTLGADNGIGIALMMMVATDEDVEHPPLELLFTVDEERGLKGAEKVKPDFLKGEILLNLDSEEFGEFTIGCAGGGRRRVLRPITSGPVRPGHDPYRIVVKGLKGGHSGVDIHLGRGNAIRILARVLNKLRDYVDIAHIKGGKAMNAIPRDAEAVVFDRMPSLTNIKDVVSAMMRKVKAQFKYTDPDVEISIEEVKDNVPESVLTYPTDSEVIDLLLGIHHGVWEMSPNIKGLVETSSNLAAVNIKGQMLEVLTMQRSSSDEGMDDMLDQINAVARRCKAQIEVDDEYPGWEPDPESPLLMKCKNLFTELFGYEPEIGAIHAGLECGLFKGNYPKMQIISFGPTINNPHSPDEEVDIESIEQTWVFLAKLLAELK